MTAPGPCATPEVDRKRTLNDALRTSLTGGSVMLTRAVAALGAELGRNFWFYDFTTECSSGLYDVQYGFLKICKSHSGSKGSASEVRRLHGEKSI